MYTTQQQEPLYQQPMYNQMNYQQQPMVYQQQIQPLYQQQQQPMYQQQTQIIYQQSQQPKQQMQQIPINANIQGTNNQQPSTANISANNGYNPNDFIKSQPTMLDIKPGNEETQITGQNGKGFLASLCNINSNCCSLATSVVMLVGIVLLIMSLFSSTSPILGGVIFIIGWIVNVIETIRYSSTTKYLRHIKSAEECEQYMNKMSETSPIFWWSIQNYHYDITTTEEGSKEKHRVNTHYSKGQFIYNQWKDISNIKPNLNKYNITKIKLSVEGLFGDIFTTNEYQRQFNFFKQSKTTDEVQTVETGVTLNGLEERILCKSNSNNNCCISLIWLCINTIFGFGYCFRTWLEGKSGRCHYTYKKQVFCVSNVLQPQNMIVVQN